MKKWLFVPLLLLLAACSSVGNTTGDTADWPEYINSDFGYAFRYPAACSLGPLAAHCKQSPPEERPPECLCFLNPETSYGVTLQSFLDQSEGGQSLATFSVLHPDTAAFNPPEGEELASWINSEWAYISENIPAEPNFEIDRVPAMLVEAPGSPQGTPSESIFVLKNGQLLQIQLLDPEIEANRELYDSILATFRFTE